MRGNSSHLVLHAAMRANNDDVDDDGDTYYYYYNDPLSGTTQVSRYQKDKPFWILLKQKYGVAVASAEPYASYLHFTPEDNHASTSSLEIFTGRMPFLTPNQQHQSTGWASTRRINHS